jgi:hypothetical protein
MRVFCRLEIWPLLLVLGCGASDTGSPARFDPNDLQKTLVWLKNTYEPVETVPAPEQNPLAKKEARERERAKFADQMQKIKGTPIRWSINVEKLTTDSFQPTKWMKVASGRGAAVGRLKMYREAQPRIETTGLIFKETVDHAISKFEVTLDISPDLYKRLTPTGRVVIHGEVFDIDGERGTGSDAYFDIVLVKIKVVDVLP